MELGTSVVVDGRVMEVMGLDLSGDMLVRDVLTLKLKWVDYYIARVFDPHEDGGALLEAMGALTDDDVAPSEEEETHVPSAE